MITIHLDGVPLELADGTTLGSVIRVPDPECCVAVIRPGTQERERTENIQVTTTAGEMTVEISVPGVIQLEDGSFVRDLNLHWEDRYSAAFGPFSREFVPARRPHLYERGDVILGCGGYDPKQSYLIFSRLRHSADHGAGAEGGVIGRVISGRGIIDRWQPGDRITGIVPIIAWADTTRSFTTTDTSLVLDDGMQIVSHVEMTVQGFSRDHIEPAAATSVEHLLLATATGKFRVARAASTHVFDGTWSPNDVPMELEKPRREGTVTVRTKGRSRGGIYIYTADVPGNQFHTLVGQVTHGIELPKLAKEQDIFSISVTPAMFDLLGLPLTDAEEIAGKRNILATVDDRSGGDRIVVGQDPGTTLEVLAKGSVALTTRPVSKVIDLELYDSLAPDTCRIFRRLSGLWSHNVGQIPAFFILDDVYLFRPVIPKGMNIIPENTPVSEVPAGSLAMTNEARKLVGLVGVRISSNKEFGPTSEPFEGTNIIGRVLDLEKLKSIKENDTVYIREVRR
ncbi:MAG TPA: methanogenesis marker 3 protein [Methanoregulaceae archaeon]|nr:methanogenesis marker 3 protein [Methanoregulaceae archaeon]